MLLDHVISSAGISVDPYKIEAVIKWKKPYNVLEIKSFMGLVEYYKRFIENF